MINIIIMDELTYTYKNMFHEESIGFRFSPHASLEEKTLTVGPNSKLTKSCSTTIDGPHLTFDSIKWNDILMIDIKIEAFLTGVAQKVLNKAIFNSNTGPKDMSFQKLLIQLHVGQSLPSHNCSPAYYGEIIQEAFDYFNQINSAVIEQFQIHNRKKMIYLEYIIIDNQTIYLTPLTNMKTDMFCDIEIHTNQNQFVIIEKWSVRQDSYLHDTGLQSDTYPFSHRHN